MYYNSINNKLNIKKFNNIFLTNIPKNKTLYFPFKIPKIKKKNLLFLKKLNYIDFSFEILKLFIDNIPYEDLYNLLKNSYKKINNLVKLENLYNDNFLLNLNTGKTLTFKDIAMVPLSNLINYFSFKLKKKYVIFCATSGDTGASCNNSFKKNKNIKVFTFFPFNMISNIQRKQITTINSKCINNISLLGNFDTSQYFVKKIFENIFNKNNILLISVNSINWFRIIAQVVYYCFISLKDFNNKISYIIPSGNFGNAISAFLSKKIGFPINKIISCTNDNYYIDNYIKNNEIYNIPLQKSISPSIDISIPSNFIRLINKNLFLKKNINSINSNIYSDKIYNKDIISSIEYFYNKFEKIYDPHTIITLCSLFKEKMNHQIAVSTSYPIKFLISIKKIIPSIKIKNNIKKIFFLKEKYKIFSQNFLFLINYIKKIICTKI